MSLVNHFNETFDFFVINFLILSLEASYPATHCMQTLDQQVENTLIFLLAFPTTLFEKYLLYDSKAQNVAVYMHLRLELRDNERYNLDRISV